MPNPRVMIASPTPGTVKTVYMKSVIHTMIDLAEAGISTRFETIDAADLAHQRNVLASRFVASDCTHLFFVDSDMMFNENLCRLMLAHDKPFIGVIAATKQFYLARVEEAVKRGLSVSEASLSASDWISFHLPDQPQLKVESGIMEVAKVGFGIVLLNRSALAMMIERGVAPPYGTGGDPPTYNFFGARAADAAAGRHMAEDMSFCARWSEDCGGRIFALVDTPIYHVGDFGYGGSYFQYLQTMLKLQGGGPS
jgi:hypothetical protein